MTNAGETIYSAFTPTLKMSFCVAIGYILVKRGLFSPQAARGVSTLSLNVGLPALLFNSIVSAFTSDNIVAMGPLVLMGILYQILGTLCALVVREIFYVPQDFQWGILVLGCISNWGNQPQAVMQTVGQSAPFNGSADVALGVAYVGVYILLLSTVMFPLGLHKVCALDFKPENLEKEPPAPFSERWAGRIETAKRVIFRRNRSASVASSKRSDDSIEQVNSERTAYEGEKRISSEQPDEKVPYAGGSRQPNVSFQPEHRRRKQKEAEESDHDEHDDKPASLRAAARALAANIPTRKVSRANSLSSIRPIPPTAPLDAVDISSPCVASSSSLPAPMPPLLPVCSNHGAPLDFHRPVTPPPSIQERTWKSVLKATLESLLMPASMAMVVAIPCALVKPLKALFVEVDGWTGTRMPNAPDGKPPLHFVTDTASFLGGMSVPAALILLGASLARLKLPSTRRAWAQQPLAAALAMMTVKMIISPAFGILVVRAMRDHTSLFPKEDLPRTFIALLVGGTPAAVNQLVVTQLYNPAGSADTLALFLGVQYILMPILSTAGAAVALYITGSRTS